MAEIYSSLYKGLIHITTKFSSAHPAIDMGNYKTKNPVYSGSKLGNGTVQSVSTSYKSPATGKTYYNSLVVWIKYDNGMRCGMYHGEVGDKVVNVGDRVYPGMQVYRTGNTGNSSADHLHYNLQNSQNINIDPTPYVTNDKFTPLSTGTRIEQTTDMNIRDANFADIGSAKKGSVCEVKIYYKDYLGYPFYKVGFADKECYIADTSLNIVSKKPVTNLDGSKPISEIDTLKEEIKRLELIVEAQKIKIVELSTEIVQLESEVVKLEMYEDYFEKLSILLETKLSME